MQTVGPLSADHLSSGVLVDDNDAHFPLIVRANHVVTVSLIDHVGPQRLFQKVGEVNVVANVERTNSRFSLGFGYTFVGNACAFLVQFNFKVLLVSISAGFQFGKFEFGFFKLGFHGRGRCLVPAISDVPFEARASYHAFLNEIIGGSPFFLLLNKVDCQLIRKFVPRAYGVCGAGNDQRSSRFIDENRVDFIDDGKLS